MTTDHAEHDICTAQHDDDEHQRESGHRRAHQPASDDVRGTESGAER